ncbi:MAG: hypothetical protein K1X79_13535 [Oligoflexia bacterium]|nr:hypothetical protein [Oligoflexia bacterium]
MARKFALLVLVLAVASPSLVLADVCSDDCPAGQVKSSFLDGSHVTCVCVEPGVQMEDDPADAHPPAGGEGQEPGE